jgi:MFS family permease
LNQFVLALPPKSTVIESSKDVAAGEGHALAGAAAKSAVAAATGYQSTTLKSRSYIGLVASQFLAAFNDQASHIVAFFYATDMLVRYVALPHVDTKVVVSIVTACFISPFFLFSPLAGVLADKFSKRSIIVAWKLAEVGIMALAVAGFLLPHIGAWLGLSLPAVAVVSSVMLVSIVFLMGTHSAFFIPAKYGMMPEILDTSVLSRGNGLLEGTSFVANIMGTVTGGLLYGLVKSRIEVTSTANILHPGNEWIIGVLLLALAILGFVASLWIERIPAAAPDKRLVLEPWTPMKQNIAVLRRSRSLVLAAVGIAFFLFMTLYLRQSLLFQGELAEEIQFAKKMDAPAAVAHEPLSEPNGTENVNIPAVVEAADQTPGTKTEFQVAALIGLIGLGVGVGCSLAGYFSGNRIELGLVPIGLVLLIVTTAGMALVVPAPMKMVSCLIAIGAAAGLYIVPLYTLLQHRSPKDSKGSLVATSNFLNVTGGLIAVVVFFLVTWNLQSVMGLNLTAEAVRHKPELIAPYRHQLDRATQIPKLLFTSASFITLIVYAWLWWHRPDFILRAASWLRSSKRRHLRALGLDNVPFNGQVLLISNSHDFDHWVYVVSVIDRFARFVAPPEGRGDGFLRGIAMRTGVMIAADPKVRLSPEDNALARGLVTLGQGNLLGLSLAEDFAADRDNPASGEQLLGDLRAKVPATILPVYCGENPTHPDAVRHPERHTYVVIGEPMPADTPLSKIRAAVAALGT